MENLIFESLTLHPSSLDQVCMGKIRDGWRIEFVVPGIKNDVGLYKVLLSKPEMEK